MSIRAIQYFLKPNVIQNNLQMFFPNNSRNGSPQPHPEQNNFRLNTNSYSFNSLENLLPATSSQGNSKMLEFRNQCTKLSTLNAPTEVIATLSHKFHTQNNIPNSQETLLTLYLQTNETTCKPEASSSIEHKQHPLERHTQSLRK